MPKKPTKKANRIINQLRKLLPGTWRYIPQLNGTHLWERSDGLKVYPLSHCSISVGGAETYYTRWYQEFNGKIDVLYAVGKMLIRSRSSADRAGDF